MSPPEGATPPAPMLPRPGWLSPSATDPCTTPPVPLAAPQPHASGVASPAPAPRPALPPGTPATDPDFLRRSLRQRASICTPPSGEGGLAVDGAVSGGSCASNANPLAPLQPPSPPGGVGAFASSPAPGRTESVQLPGGANSPSFGGSPASPPPLPPPPPLAAPWQPWAGAQDLALGGPGQPWAPVRGRCQNTPPPMAVAAPPAQRATLPPGGAWGHSPCFPSSSASFGSATPPYPRLSTCGSGGGGSVSFGASNVGAGLGAACGPLGTAGSARFASFGPAYPCSPPAASRSLSPPPPRAAVPPATGGFSQQRARTPHATRPQEPSYASAGWAPVVATSGNWQERSPSLPSTGASCSAALRQANGSQTEGPGWAPVVYREPRDSVPGHGLPMPPSPVGSCSLPPTQVNLHCQDEGLMSSGPLAVDVDFTSRCSPAPIHQRGASESHQGVPYPESFDYSEPTWLRAPFGVQHQVTG